MSEIAFPLKDLARRKLQTSLTILGLTICTAATVFLLVFGHSLGFEIAFLTGGKLTTGFSNIFSRFVIVIGLLNLLAGALVTSFLVYMVMSERVRDIGVMKAAGCLTGSVFSYFITELSIVVFISCIAGTIFGILTYFACIHLLNTLSFSISQGPLNLWTIFIIFLAFLFASHISGAWPIVKAIRVKPAEALSPLYSFGTTFHVGSAKPSKLGTTLKIAYRSLMRRKFTTRQAIICLATVLTLTTVTIMGGIIANQTTQNYVERAICRDVVLVSHPDLSTVYVNLLSQFFEVKEKEQVNYLDSKYIISNFLVSRLSNIPGVLEADPRLVLEATIYEVPGVIVDPEEPDRYILVGDDRSGEALIVGIRPEHVINEWLVLGRVLNETDSYSALVGDSLALKMFAVPQKQSVKILEKNFEIAGVCLDPLNNGNVVYVPLKTLSTLFPQHDYNFLFLRIDPSRRTQVLAEIGKEILGMELELLELNEILGKHTEFLNFIWSSVMFLPLSSLVTATLCLLGYVVLSITGQQ